MNPTDPSVPPPGAELEQPLAPGFGLSNARTQQIAVALTSAKERNRWLEFLLNGAETAVVLGRPAIFARHLAELAERVQLLAGAIRRIENLALEDSQTDCARHLREALANPGRAGIRADHVDGSLATLLAPPPPSGH